MLRILLAAFTLLLSIRAEEPPARGFEEGQTLPDISLVDLEGQEVRFSDFLGKQVVLYGWASW